VCPTIDWTAEGGPNFTDAPCSNYRFDPPDILRPNVGGCLLEVPATIGFWQGNHRMQLAVTRHLSGRLARPFHILGILDRMGVVNHRWLSPEQSSAMDMMRLAEKFVAAGYDSLNLFFHSNSLLPGISPFVRTGAELERFLRRIETFIEFAAQAGMEFSPLSKALKSEMPI
jgi:hypothetical protein